MKADKMRQYEFLKRIGFIRTCGSEEEKRAAAMIADEVRKIGLEPVTESFTVTRSLPVEARFTMVEPTEKEYPVRGYVYTKPVCVREETYEFGYLEQIDEVSLARARGKFVLLNERVTKQEDYDALVKAGVKGILTMEGRVIDRREDTDLGEGRMRAFVTEDPYLPAVQMRMCDAFCLLAENPRRVRVTSVSEEKTVTSRNVVVTVPGWEFPDEYIAVGAHYDTTEFSTGVWDNGAGVVEILELLRHFKENPPRRTVKFIFFGAEEVGLKGSRAYLTMHPEEIEKIRFMFNLDVGGNRMGSNFIIVSAEKELEGYLQGIAKEAGYSTAVENGVMSSDCAVFNDYGIPAVSIARRAPKGAGFMHTRYDMMSLISPEALESLTNYLILAADRMINAAVFPVQKVISEELSQKVIDYFGKGQSETEKRRKEAEEK